MADLEDYSSESDYYSESSEYSSYDSYASSLSDYDLPAGGALPPSESALSTNLHEHIILRRRSKQYKNWQSLQWLDLGKYVP